MILRKHYTDIQYIIIFKNHNKKKKDKHLEPAFTNARSESVI
ncbi:hypothetical protein HMPREF9442_03006 [Paraprevotella xylaniphila YIT 11841]|uniref:Uncharacterized protein n=1 Tax=Paraprevotella xylaniphila YIT 11841 TaxID=762982 RepID=F3QXR7_9BACT|nr:hypothetical protein HMPREF9442_03006 [Paraprevotella xylaniphila YIT 11841]